MKTANAPAGTKFCTGCGEAIAPDARFCGACGAKQEDADGSS